MPYHATVMSHLTPCRMLREHLAHASCTPIDLASRDATLCARAALALPAKTHAKLPNKAASSTADALHTQALAFTRYDLQQTPLMQHATWNLQASVMTGAAAAPNTQRPLSARRTVRRSRLSDGGYRAGLSVLWVGSCRVNRVGSTGHVSLRWLGWAGLGWAGLATVTHCGLSTHSSTVHCGPLCYTYSEYGH